jgi:hypothetical protein
LVLCLVVVCAVGAFAAAGAWAGGPPAVWQCGAAAKSGKTYTGHYTSKKCVGAPGSHQVESGGKYEFEEWLLGTKEDGLGKKGKAKEMSAKNAKGTGANLEIVGEGGLNCTKAGLLKPAKKGEGAQFTGPKSAGKIIATFSGCELLHKSCKSLQPGVAPGEIRTFPLKGELGYLNYIEHGLVGVAFSPESGTYLAHMECANEIEFRVSGSVIGEVVKAGGPYNTWAKGFKLKFFESNGHQECQGGLSKPVLCETLEGVPGTHSLLTELANYGEENWYETFVSGEEATIEVKGEELYLKA